MVLDTKGRKVEKVDGGKGGGKRNESWNELAWNELPVSAIAPGTAAGATAAGGAAATPGVVMLTP